MSTPIVSKQPIPGTQSTAPVQTSITQWKDHILEVAIPQKPRAEEVRGFFATIGNFFSRLFNWTKSAVARAENASLFAHEDVSQSVRKMFSAIADENPEKHDLPAFGRHLEDALQTCRGIAARTGEDPDAVLAQHVYAQAYRMDAKTLNCLAHNAGVVVGIPGSSLFSHAPSTEQRNTLDTVYTALVQVQESRQALQGAQTQASTQVSEPPIAKVALPQQNQPPQTFSMAAEAVVQQPGTNNCYIDSSLYAILKSPGGEAFLKRHLQEDDKHWTVSFADGSNVKIDKATLHDKTPQWQQAIERACDQKLRQPPYGRLAGAEGQLDDLPKLFGMAYQDIPNAEAVDLKQAIIDQSSPGYRAEARGIVASILDNSQAGLAKALQEGKCVTYVTGNHVVSLKAIAGDGDNAKYTFLNPLHGGKTADVSYTWPELREKLMQNLEGQGGGQFCIFEVPKPSGARA